jgi:hypothetical protein
LWGRGEVHPRFWWGDLKEKDHLESINLNLQEIGCGYVDWIELAENRDKWLAFVKKVMDIRLLGEEKNILHLL